MRYLVDPFYPDAPLIDGVMDNWNTHAAEVLIEIFGKAEADRLLNRLKFHDTPLHGSWLNTAEIELRVMQRQWLKRRLADVFTSRWAPNWWHGKSRTLTRGGVIRWKFTTQDARRVFAMY
jgi:hypothetical protein